jgi:hypothetical protein
MQKPHSAAVLAGWPPEKQILRNDLLFDPVIGGIATPLKQLDQ